ncbi:hypothetical protein RA2_03989 [Roseovarius sp. A-2]|nr:hypothetical protein RA2_03989 [Roseovarius sp. A-2]
MKDMMIGVDLAKNVFQVHGALRTGEVQFRKKLTRKQFPAFMARQAPCLIIFEACGSAHYWAREMEALGHEVKLIAPQYACPILTGLTALIYAPASGASSRVASSRATTS